MKLTLGELKQNFNSYIRLEKEISNISYERMIDMTRTFIYSLFTIGYLNYGIEESDKFIDECYEMVREIYQINK